MSLQTKPTAKAFDSTRFTVALDRRVLHHIRKHSVLTPGEHTIVAVSGGPDSTALLVLLSRLYPKLRLDLTVAHFDHQLRGTEEAAADLEFVRSVAASLELPLVHGSGNVRTHAHERHLSIEDAARRLRYAFLSEQAAALGAPADASVVAVGHTLDDQAETVLLHLIRGAGLAGVAAMSPRAPWPFGAGPELARPLLALRRDDTHRYCREIGLQPREDPTNEMLTATRNQVRNEVLALLRRLNPRIEEALTRFAAAAVVDVAYLDGLASQAFSLLAQPGTSTVTLPRNELAALPLAVQVRVIRLAFAHARGSSADLESTHTDAILEAIHGPPGSLSLPGDLTATLDSSALIISQAPLRYAHGIDPTQLAVPGRTEAGTWRIDASIKPPPASSTSQDPLDAFLDADRTGSQLTVRSRRPGDRLRPLGLGGEKKVQDILVDAKVPARDRDAVPIVCAGDQIAWVVGQCLDQRFAITANTRQALHLVASQAS
jgi:tRNA(Ile)-lysidine synthase